MLQNLETQIPHTHIHSRMTNSTNIKSLLIPHIHNPRGHLLKIMTTYQAETLNDNTNEQERHKLHT